MYTDLIRIEHPANALAGSLVTIYVYIKNQHSVGIYIAPSATVNGVLEVGFTPNYAAVNPGVTAIFTGTFIMPSVDAVITAYSWYWGTDSAWHQEDDQARTVSLSQAPVEEYETLEVDITPVNGGVVGTYPASKEGKTVWYNDDTGTFPSGVSVKVTANPYPGYLFDHWSDEIAGGVSYQNPDYVQPMTQHRAVKCHFREEAVLDNQTLEIDITPAGTGYVTTEPASNEGKTEWHHDNTGTFSYGITVKVTAHPNTGYVFEKWSDEIAGGVSTNNPDYVQPMTQYRAVKCHFNEETEPPVGGEEGISKFSIWSGELGLWAELNEQLPPASGVQTRHMFKIEVVGWNPSTSASKMGLHYTITKPDESTIEQTVEEAWPYTGGLESHTFKEPAGVTEAYAADQIGSWSIVVELLDDGVVIDTWSGVLFVVEQAPSSVFDMLEIIPAFMIIMVLSMVMQMMPEATGAMGTQASRLGEKGVLKAKEEVRKAKGYIFP